jgi:hypothetical protein
MKYTVVIKESTFQRLDVDALNEDDAERTVVAMLESDLRIEDSSNYQRISEDTEITVYEKEEDA